MKRDKEWLREGINELINGYTSFGGHQHLYISKKNIEKLYHLIDQLDEPEKVTIPQEAADWIESVRNLSNSMSCLMTYDQIKRFSYELTLWCYESGNNDNLHKLARAWLDGYEVEKEKLYYIPLGVKRAGESPVYLIKGSKGIDIDWSRSRYIENEKYAHSYRFTESEIKSIIPNYWPFAQPVEESP